jgi:hypothetical protein
MNVEAARSEKPESLSSQRIFRVQALNFTNQMVTARNLAGPSNGADV